MSIFKGLLPVCRPQPELAIILLLLVGGAMEDWRSWVCHYFGHFETLGVCIPLSTGVCCVEPAGPQSFLQRATRCWWRSLGRCLGVCASRSLSVMPSLSKRERYPPETTSRSQRPKLFRTLYWRHVKREASCMQHGVGVETYSTYCTPILLAPVHFVREILPNDGATYPYLSILSIHNRVNFTARYVHT